MPSVWVRADSLYWVEDKILAFELHFYDSSDALIDYTVYELTITDLCGAHQTELIDFGGYLVTTQFIAGDSSPKLVSRITMEESNWQEFKFTMATIVSPNGAPLKTDTGAASACATYFVDNIYDYGTIAMTDVSDISTCRTTDL